MTISVRAIEPKDRSDWEALWQGFLMFSEMELAPDITSTTWRRVCSAEQQPHGLLAYAPSGQAVGLAHYLFHRSSWSASDVCYLEDLFVSPKARGQGVARALIGAVEHAARAERCAEMYLVADADNAEARALYDQVMETTAHIEYRKAIE